MTEPAARAGDRNGSPRPQPIFLLSITRSGSTLVQRVLASHQGVATVSEPWILLPLLYTLRKRGVVSEYTHYLAVDAVEDFAEQLPGGLDDYRGELRELAMRLYTRAAPAGTRYFLDKTPPYFLIADDLFDLFPDAKFVFLWRNPLSIVSSLIEYRGGTWEPAAYRENLFDGIARLVAAWERHGDRAFAVRYEDLITGGEAPWRAIADYLELDFDRTALVDLSRTRLNGRMGDQFGPERYTSLSSEPLAKWKQRLGNPVRRWWCERHLRWIGRRRLAVMGYDLDALLAELAEVPNSSEAVLADSAALARALLKEPLRVRARSSVGLGGPSVFRYLLSTGDR